MPTNETNSPRYSTAWNGWMVERGVRQKVLIGQLIIPPFAKERNPYNSRHQPSATKPVPNFK
jgi:hypothetical protein